MLLCNNNLIVTIGIHLLPLSPSFTLWYSISFPNTLALQILVIKTTDYHCSHCCWSSARLRVYFLHAVDHGGFRCCGKKDILYFAGWLQAISAHIFLSLLIFLSFFSSSSIPSLIRSEPLKSLIWRTTVLLRVWLPAKLSSIVRHSHLKEWC